MGVEPGNEASVLHVDHCDVAVQRFIHGFNEPREYNEVIYTAARVPKEGSVL